MNKRILSIWDFRTVPYSYGDLITLMEYLQCEMINHKVNKFDIVFAIDHNNPVRNKRYINGVFTEIKDRNSQGVTKDNFHYHFQTLISTIYANKNIGSFFIFDDYNKLDEFIEDNKDNYIFIPSIEDYKNQVFTFRNNFNLIQEFYIKNKYIPKFELRQGSIENAYLFYRDKLEGKFPVVCHIRNSEGHPERNANLNEWFMFFGYCNEHHKEIVFILIGMKEENIFFQGLSNVLISKDYFNTAEMDMSLIATSLMFLGSRSGPIMTSYFTKVPCLIFGYDTAAHEKVEKESQYIFTNENQKLCWGDYDSDLMIKEFELLYNKVNKESWLKEFSKYKDLKYNKSEIRL
jgi:hypothetical protein